MHEFYFYTVKMFFLYIHIFLYKRYAYIFVSETGLIHRLYRYNNNSYLHSIYFQIKLTKYQRLIWSDWYRYDSKNRTEYGGQLAQFLCPVSNSDLNLSKKMFLKHKLIRSSWDLVKDCRLRRQAFTRSHDDIL